MKNNETLQRDVLDAIKWEPMLQAAEIGVTAINGVVTLSGTVDSYAKKIEAESAAKHVSGVRAVVEKIEVRLSDTDSVTDNDLAREVVNAFNWNWKIPKGKIKVTVENGWVTLEGELLWNYQREAAHNSVYDIPGLKGITNKILITSETAAGIEKEAIENALKRNWSIDEDNIRVAVLENKVTLTGSVHSLYQKDVAGKIAGNAPGVFTVENELVID